MALDGSITPVAGVLPAAMAAYGRQHGLICPEACGPEAAWAGSDIDILAPRSLIQLANHFKGTQVMALPEPAIAPPPAPCRTCATSRARRAPSARSRSPRPAAIIF